jgi:hypothetical protein
MWLTLITQLLFFLDTQKMIKQRQFFLGSLVVLDLAHYQEWQQELIAIADHFFQLLERKQRQHVKKLGLSSGKTHIINRWNLQE